MNIELIKEIQLFLPPYFDCLFYISWSQVSLAIHLPGVGPKSCGYSLNLYSSINLLWLTPSMFEGAQFWVLDMLHLLFKSFHMPPFSKDNVISDATFDCYNVNFNPAYPKLSTLGNSLNETSNPCLFLNLRIQPIFAPYLPNPINCVWCIEINNKQCYKHSPIKRLNLNGCHGVEANYLGQLLFIFLGGKLSFMIQGALKK